MSQSEPPINTPFIVPEYLIAGEIWNWLVGLTQFTPADGFTLKYYFNLLNTFNVNNTSFSFNIDASVNGNNFWLYKDSATISSLVAGDYQWYSLASGTSNGTTVRQKAQWGQLTIFPDQTTGVDVRTLERQMLDALNAMLLDTASLEQAEYTIGNRHIGKMDREELLKYRDKFKNICNAQAKKMAFDSGNTKATNDIRLYMGGPNGSPQLSPYSPWRGPQ